MIGQGQRAPDFALPRADGVAARYYGTIGGAPAILVFAAAGPTATEVVAQLRAGDPGMRIDLVTLDQAVAVANDGLYDPEGRAHAAYGVDAEGPSVAVVLDPNVRVVATLTLDVSDAAAILAAAHGSDHDGDDSTFRRHAPVLLVPDALDPAWCTRLIDLWHAVETVETGVEATGTDGGRSEVSDGLRKRRRDHTIVEADLLGELTRYVGARVMPEVRKAFAYRANRFEGFKLGGYEATTAGFFEAHRDNLSPATQHRRFALSINLNADYAGGELRFPEYGRQRYRPATGEALVFSGSLLHEVLPVTRGQRFVALSFLFGDDAVRH